MKLLYLAIFTLITFGCSNHYTDKEGNTFGSWQYLNKPEQFTKKGGKGVYEFKDDTIIGITRPKTSNTFLVSKKRFSDFELELEFKVDPRLNSGIQFRSNTRKDKNGNERVWGYQCEIDPSSRAWSAGIFEELGRGWLNTLKENEAARKAFKQNDWNKVRILAIGDHLRTWVNDVPAADLKDSKTKEGFIGLQVHWIKSDEEWLVMWRNIRVREVVE